MNEGNLPSCYKFSKKGIPTPADPCSTSPPGAFHPVDLFEANRSCQSKDQPRRSKSPSFGQLTRGQCAEKTTGTWLGLQRSIFGLDWSVTRDKARRPDRKVQRKKGRREKPEEEEGGGQRGCRSTRQRGTGRAGRKGKEGRTTVYTVDVLHVPGVHLLLGSLCSLGGRVI